MASECLERVAAAILSVAYLPIAEKVRAHYEEQGWPKPDDSEIRACWAMAQARAAIEAMKEPTARMLSDADSAIPRAEPDETGFRMMGTEVALEAWRAMINAALSDTRSEGTGLIPVLRIEGLDE